MMTLSTGNRAVAALVFLFLAACVNDPDNQFKSPTEITDNAHLDIVSVGIASGKVYLKIDHSHHDDLLEPEATIIRVRATGKSLIGSDTGFSFLGSAGSPVWHLDGGWSVRGVTTSVFTGDSLVLRLHGVDGPGLFGAWRFDGQSRPSINFASNRAFPQNLTMSHTAHVHRTWSFATPGLYTLRFEVLAQNAVTGAVLTSGIRTYTFSVEE